ncbi:hypothetical protein JKP88DRAFT_215478 [Tribonema minus]|uniref:Uncharacterized protein n=1 Tax=Tribonema minus TaxID=303371 RepID=A0A835YQX9_9STRA|nr:hypothetical protein JKP88DRAFT_215478 [Tribonema minus]
MPATLSAVDLHTSTFDMPVSWPSGVTKLDITCGSAPVTFPPRLTHFSSDSGYIGQAAFPDTILYMELNDMDTFSCGHDDFGNEEFPFHFPPVLPMQLRELRIKQMGLGEIINIPALPPKLELLHIDCRVTPTWLVSPTHLPKDLRVCILEMPDLGFILEELPSKLKELSFRADCGFDQPLPALPQTLRKLRLGRSFTHPLTLPAGIEEVVLPLALAHRVKFPRGVKVEWV